ncbi:MAG: polysaccharide deacetylase family protein [Oscillospiraceae bacterium]|nr:polysaccharide deacetylase family protein [Oscillospiraceae bacterium]
MENSSSVPSFSTTVPSSTVPPTTVPPTTVPPTTVPPTTVPPTTVPPTTVPPTTVPPTTVLLTTVPDNGDEMIGSLYTRAQLEAMDGTNLGCSFYGSVDAKNRPDISVAYTARFSKYGAQYIAPDNGKIYLTFTLGYEHTIQKNGQTIRVTDWILDTLKDKNVKAVFFINMYYAKSCPDIVQRIIDEGHIIANHSSNHYTLPEISIDRVVSEIMNLHDYVLEHFGYKMTLFRPPSGYSSERVFAIAQSLGYSSANYSFAYVDWDTNNQPDPNSSLQNMVNRAHSGGIYQLHTVSATNAQILGAAIDAIREKGLEFDLYTPS